MYWLKQCTKCGGDLASDSDQYGSYLSCIQCGRYLDVEIKKGESPGVRLIPVQPAAAAVLSGNGFRTDTRWFSPYRRSAAVAA